jgi:hypothetical protein
LRRLENITQGNEHLMEGFFGFLSHVGAVTAAIGILKAVGRLIANSAGYAPKPGNPVTLQTLARLARHLAREERTILFLFVATSIGLLAKYFGGWPGLPGYFLEFVNLFAVVNFWVHFRTTDLTNPR